MFKKLTNLTKRFKLRKDYFYKKEWHDSNNRIEYASIAFIGICSKFQGLGLLFSTDCPVAMQKRRISLELNILWLRAHIVFDKY